MSYTENDHLTNSYFGFVKSNPSVISVLKPSSSIILVSMYI